MQEHTRVGHRRRAAECSRRAVGVHEHGRGPAGAELCGRMNGYLTPRPTRLHTPCACVIIQVVDIETIGGPTLSRVSHRRRFL